MTPSLPKTSETIFLYYFSVLFFCIIFLYYFSAFFFCSMPLPAYTTIAVDIDEVLAHFLPSLCSYHNSLYGTSLSSFHSYEFWNVWGGDRDQATYKCFQFFASTWFTDIVPIKHAREVMEDLKERFHVRFVVVTSRQLDIAEETRAWLNKHFGALFADVQFGHHFSKAGDERKGRTKVEMCSEIGAKVLIDDNLTYAKQCSQMLDVVYLFDFENSYPYNKNMENESLAENIVRVDSWLTLKPLLENYLKPFKKSS